MGMPKEEQARILAEEAPKKKSKLKIYFSLFGLAITLGVGGFLYWFSHQAANGTIKAVTKVDQKLTQSEDIPATFNGKYVSFMYGNSYQLKSDDAETDSSGIFLERAYLSEVGAISQKINLTVRNLPSGNLEDDPDYLMRQNDTEHYKKENFSLGKNEGVAFSSAYSSQFAKTYFILDNNRVATLTLSAPGSEDKALDGEADQIMMSFAWVR